jgi:hypothetical protein
MNIAARPFGLNLNAYGKWDNLAEAFTVKRVLAVLMLLALMLFAIGWLSREDPSKKPYLEILGGGFIFNYRVPEVYYGFTAMVEKPLAVGSIVEVTFENPAGGDPLVVSQRVNARTPRYAFRSPPVHGVVAQKPYHVTIRIYDRQRKELIWTMERDYKSVISDKVMPEKPLTVGPGYHRNPDL